MYATGTSLSRWSYVAGEYEFLPLEGGKSDCRTAKLRRNYSQAWMRANFLTTYVIFRTLVVNDIIVGTRYSSRRALHMVR